MTSAARRRALRDYLLDLRDEMRLHAWDLEVSPLAPDSSCVISIIPQGVLHHAAVRVGTYFSDSRAEQRQSAVHELVHLIQADMWEGFDDGVIRGALHDRGLDWIAATVHVHLEVQADAIARLLAPRLPMPPAWPK